MPKLTIQQLLKNPKTKLQLEDDVPGWAGTLKSYKEERAKILSFCYAQQVGNKYCIVISDYKNNLKLVLDYFDIKITKTNYEIYTDSRYESRCTKWGAYNPNSYLIIKKINETNNNKIIIETLIKEEYLNHGSIPKIGYSEYYQTRNKIVSGYKITENYIIYKNKKYCQYNVIFKHGVSYHYNPKHIKTKKAIQDLENKIKIKNQKKDANKKELKENESKYGKKITFSELKNKFGWCEIGMNIVRSAMGLGKSEYAKKIISAYKKMYPHDKSEIIEFRGEISQLLNYCRLHK